MSLSSRTNAIKLAKYQKILKQINALSNEYALLSDEELQYKTVLFKEYLLSGKTIEDIIVEAFATIREAAKRVLGLYPYDVQVLGALVMSDNQIAEMKTGEGKTLTAILPLYLNALTGKSTILVTANEYLAIRDAKEMAPVFNFLGLTVAVAVSDNPKKIFKIPEKQFIYQHDIVYTTHSALGFDYINEKLIQNKEDYFLPEFHFVLVDEVDAALLDSAQMPLIISGSPRVQSNLYTMADGFVKILKENEDYRLDPSRKSVWLTGKGVQVAQQYFQTENIYDPDNHQLMRQIILALRANYLMEKDRQYTVDGKEIKLMDESTGRLLEGNKLQSGLHQALEAKEGVEITMETRSMASVTFQNLFRLFPKLCGMTGTAWVAQREFRQVYGVDVVIIPTNKPNQRIDYPDDIFMTLEAKIEAAMDFVKKLHAKGQPVLLATGSVGMSEIFSMILLKEGIPHNVINAHNAAKEAEMVALAGQKGMVTVATAMAGRGTDILLGEGVAELGGLAVVGTDRMLSKRVDLQLRGRAGRQGSVGMSKFFVSLEDELIISFGSQWLSDYYHKNVKRNRGKIDSKRVRSAVEEAQKTADNQAAAARRSTEDFDKSVRAQQQIIYRRRRQVMEDKSFDANQFKELLSNVLQRQYQYSPFKDIKEVFRFVLDHVSYRCESVPNDLDVNNVQTVINFVEKIMLSEFYEKKALVNDDELFTQFLRRVILKAIDDAWIEQFDYLQQFQSVIVTQGYAQKNPVNEFHKEAYVTFQTMNEYIELNTIKNLCLSHLIIDKKKNLTIHFG